MPSLLTAPRTKASSGLSRVNSFQRSWDDDLPQQSSSAIEWSPSPERVKRKTAPLPAPPAAPALTIGETPADRRRRAILAAMGESSGGSSSSSTSKAPTASSGAAPFRLHGSRSRASSAASTSSASSTRGAPIPSSRISASASLPLRPVERQELPSLTKKRSLPWEGDFATAKKVMDSDGVTRATATPVTSSSTTKSSIIPSINIKQKLVLSAEQQKVLQIVVGEGKNVFFTGSAGVGKSVLLREMIKNLQRKHAKAQDAVAVTASTGIAACNIGGITLHSFGGAGLALEKAEELVKKIRRNKKAASRWMRTKVLIIDEISMVDAALFDKYNKIGQLMRKSPNKPFGGIQVILTGDFFQLPPVTKGGAEPKFCFEAETWTESIDTSVNLTKVFRQKDQRFIDMLNEMRFGRLSPQSITAFKSLARPIHYNDGIEPTRLFPRREDVERANNQRLSALGTDGWSYIATDGGALQDVQQREKLLANFMAPHTIYLKINAQVMLIKNVDETLVNGSMGIVIGFCHKAEYFTDSAGRWRENGLEEEIASEVDDKKRKMRELLRLKSAPLPGSKPCPVVRFNVPGGSKRDMLVEYDSFRTELPNGEVQVSRTQIPLILAWAMSIHKAQGQTLDRVKVDLGKVFEKGQAYVALSRATSLEGLEVTGFSAEKVMAHRKVAVWSQTLQNLSV